VADERPLLFHTGPRRLFPLVSEAVKRVLPLEQLHYIAFSQPAHLTRRRRRSDLASAMPADPPATAMVFARQRCALQKFNARDC